MTQAFNLAQLANNLNTSGQLDATDGLNGLVANANLASSGTASSSTYLRGDRTWATVTQKILQVVQVVKTDTYSGSFGSAGAEASIGSNFQIQITPTASSSKILLIASFNIQANSGSRAMGFSFARNGTKISAATGDAASNRTRVTGGYGWNGSYGFPTVTMQYLDSPASTSQQTYTLIAHDAWNGIGTFIMNYTVDNADASYVERGASMWTAMEISA